MKFMSKLQVEPIDTSTTATLNVLDAMRAADAEKEAKRLIAKGKAAAKKPVKEVA